MKKLAVKILKGFYTDLFFSDYKFLFLQKKVFNKKISNIVSLDLRNIKDYVDEETSG
jgi:hypothetical protein